VEVGPSAAGQYFYFAGTDEERLHDFQWAINHPTAKAIICARGGYGSVRIVDKLDYSALQQYPKWLTGFSDITVFHNKWHQLELYSVHGTVPLFFAVQGEESLPITTFKNALFGKELKMEWEFHEENQFGEVTAPIVGGNLAILDSLQGTALDIDVKGKILFLEDVGEYGYKLDRMMWALKLSGKLAQIAGLVLGGFTDMKDCESVLNLSLNKILAQFVPFINGPVAFNYPAGHITNNCAIVLGASYNLVVNNTSSILAKTN
jgi:muramoyltetrapeptide carboxypeptidase